MQISKGAALIVFLSTFFIATASAKAPTSELSIAVPGLTTPIHTNERAAIQYGLWGDGFANLDPAKVREPAGDAKRYTVYFWVDIRGAPTVMYVVDYLPATKTHNALVCLPGARDKWYRTNASSIARDGLDGHCFDADKDWSRAIDQTVSANPQ